MLRGTASKQRISSTHAPARNWQPAHAHRMRVCAQSATASSNDLLIKICGVTTVQDCEHATARGAKLIGMIMWPHAKRSVSDATAAAICDCARRGGARPVGVFVDEDGATMSRRAAAAGLDMVQLHGDGARAALHDIDDRFGVVYVMHATPAGEVVTPVPSAVHCSEGGTKRKPDFVLVDSMKGGSGEAFDWQRLQVPVHEASKGWLLAGGLRPHNVAEAIRIARPTGVDVSSGVCGPDGLAKDADAVDAFIANAAGAAVAA